MNKKYDKDINLALISSREYLFYLVVLIQSIQDNNPNTYFHVYIISDVLVDKDLDVLNDYKKQFEFVLLNVTEEWISDYFVCDNVSYPVLVRAKLLIPWIVPQNVERILYLDTDIIVNKAIYDLYSMGFDENLLIACKEETVPYVPNDWYISGLNVCEYLKRYEHFYINSGVILFNITSIREEVDIRDFNKVVEKLGGSLPFIEQDVHSYFYRNRTKYIDSLQWNFHFTRSSFNELSRIQCTEKWIRENVSIVHFLEKPLNNNWYRRIHNIWWEYALKTKLGSVLFRKRLIGFESDNIKKYVLGTSI